MRKIGLILLLMFLFKQLDAGCPNSPILAICEVQTTDLKSYQGIVILYGGGYHGFYPNGWYLTSDLDSYFNSGRTNYFNLSIFSINFIKENGGYMECISSQKPFQANAKKSHDTIQYYYGESLYYIDFSYDGMPSWYNFITVKKGKKYLTPSETIFDKYYAIYDSLYLYTELYIIDDCKQILPAPSSKIMVAISDIKTINFISTPNEMWLEKISNIKAQYHIGATHWLHEIVSSRKSWNKFLKDHKSMLQ